MNAATINGKLVTNVTATKSGAYKKGTDQTGKIICAPARLFYHAKVVEKQEPTAQIITIDQLKQKWAK